MATTTVLIEPKRHGRSSESGAGGPGLWNPNSPRNMGSPGLDFQTWEGTNLERLGGHLWFFQLSVAQQMRVPHPFRVFCGRGGQAQVFQGYPSSARILRYGQATATLIFRHDQRTRAVSEVRLVSRQYKIVKLLKAYDHLLPLHDLNNGGDRDCTQEVAIRAEPVRRNFRFGGHPTTSMIQWTHKIQLTALYPRSGHRADHKRQLAV